eukprot:249241_1
MSKTRPLNQDINQQKQKNIQSNKPIKHNTDKILLAKTNNNINDLDDILEQQMENEATERETQLQLQQQLQHREHNILILYIFVLIFAAIIIMLVSKWGRTKLLTWAHRCGIDTICVKCYRFITQSIPLINSINDNDEFSINIISSPNKANRKKLHIKDPSEQEKLITNSNNNETRTKELFEPRLFGGESSILTSSNAQLLHSWLPRIYNWLDWKLLYNLNIDGSSMLTFYEKCSDKGPLIMIIKDERGYIFGVFISQTQDLNNKGHTKRFFGGADTFVFTLWPNRNKYEWAKINRFFVYFDLQNINNATITIGGGKSPALTLSNLSKGISSKCDTFNNPQLSSSSEFTVIQLEMWGFVDYK